MCKYIMHIKRRTCTKDRCANKIRFYTDKRSKSTKKYRHRRNMGKRTNNVKFKYTRTKKIYKGGESVNEQVKANVLSAFNKIGKNPTDGPVKPDEQHEQRVLQPAGKPEEQPAGKPEEQPAGKPDEQPVLQNIEPDKAIEPPIGTDGQTTAPVGFLGKITNGIAGAKEGMNGKLHDFNNTITDNKTKLFNALAVGRENISAGIVGKLNGLLPLGFEEKSTENDPNIPNPNNNLNAPVGKVGGSYKKRTKKMFNRTKHMKHMNAKR